MANLLYSDNGDGTASLNGLFKDAQGNVQNLPSDATISTATKRTVSLAEAKNAGLLYTPKKTTNNMALQSINVVENANGGLQTMRSEKQSFGQGVDTAVNLKMTVSAAATSSQVIVLGDGAGNIKLLKAIAAAVDTSYDGTFQANTLTVLNNRFAAGQATRYHGMQITAYNAAGAPASDVFTSSLVQLAKLNTNNGTIELQPINWEMSQDGSQYQLNQRLIRDFRAVIGPDNAIIFTIPPDRSISFNTSQKSQSEGFDMGLI